VLLALDGDSLAHRAYHGGPKNIRYNAISGFANWLPQLWRDERPNAIVVGWDTLTVPTYRHEAFPAYQSGRVFDDSILEQLELLPGVVRRRLRRREERRLRGGRLPRRRRKDVAR
jgi:5''-3'' exonuclease (including N-terminal domain of PolI)